MSATEGIPPESGAIQSTVPPARAGPVETFWSVRLPRWLDPWAPRVADALADGTWAAAWRGVAALAPIVAFVVGLWAQTIWPSRSIDFIYTESLSFMAVVIVGAILSGPVGVMFLLGFALQDLVSPTYVLTKHGVIESFVRQRGGQLLSYLLLAIPAVIAPLPARQMAVQAWIRIPGGLRTRFGALLALYAGVMGLLVYLWAQGMVLLIGPVYTWWPSSPDVKAIAPVQHRWEWLVAAAVLAVLMRIILEGFARRSRRAGVVQHLREQRLKDRVSRSDRLPPLLRAGLYAAGLTFVLSGVYTRWADLLLVAAVTAALGVWRVGVLGRVPDWWERAVNSIPALLRFVGAVLAGYLLAYRMFGGGTPRSPFPFLMGALGAVVVLQLLFPRPGMQAIQRRERT